MPLHRPARLVLTLLFGAALAACGMLPSIEIESKKIDYKSAGKLPPLEVPPDLTRPGADNRYAVPDIKSTATYSEYSRDRTAQPGAASSGVLPSQDSVRVERQGNQRWLVVKGVPDQVWPVVKDFWQETGFLVNLEMPEAGVMETDWAENRAKLPLGGIRGLLGKVLDQIYSTGERDKFRTRLERGADPGTTEIYISHRGMEEVYTASTKEETKWQPRPPDPGREAEMLRLLMMRFGVQEARAKVQLATAAETAAPRATLSKSGDGAGTLALNEQFDRAWRRVGLALDRVGFTVEDRDRSKGLYFVRYIDPQLDVQTKKQESTWLSRLKFWGSTEKPKTEQYRILVRDEDAAGCRVNVLDKDGAPEKSETARKILSLLYEQLK